jgi:hypothetical protein
MPQGLKHDAAQGGFEEVALNLLARDATELEKNQRVAIQTAGKMMGQSRNVLAGVLGVGATAARLKGCRQEVILTPAKIMREQLGGQSNPAANLEENRKHFELRKRFKTHPGLIDGASPHIPVGLGSPLDPTRHLTRGPIRREYPLVLKNFAAPRKASRVETASERPQKTPPQGQTALDGR